MNRWQESGAGAHGAHWPPSTAEETARLAAENARLRAALATLLDAAHTAAVALAPTSTPQPASPERRTQRQRHDRW